MSRSYPNRPNRREFLQQSAMVVGSIATGLLGGCEVNSPSLAAPPSSTAAPDNLRCEYLLNPQCIGETLPRLSWTIQSNRRGEIQRAYKILVASQPELLANNHGDLWDSGKVHTAQSTQVVYAGNALNSRDRCFWKVRIWDRDGKPSAWSQTASWTMGLLHPRDWQAKWIGVAQTLNTNPQDSSPAQWPKPRYLRKEFTLSRPVRRATIYASALGLYELRINGHRVGDHLLAPEWTDYRKRIQYQTYDVTSMLRDQSNTLAATLGNGWFCGGWQVWQKKLRPLYGTEPFLLAQLEIEYLDGSSQTIASDPTWHGMADGPLQFAGIYEGATYDARKEMPGWDTSPFDGAKWSPVSLFQPTPEFNVGKLVWQRSEPIRVTQKLPAISVTEPRPGIYVFDLGQNIAGWCQLQVQEPSGTQITLLHNEVLNPDGTAYMDNLHAGHLSTGDRQVDRYICKGTGKEIFEPNFTYHGFRYVEVHGLQSKPSASALTGVVFHTDFALVGEFECSNPLVNQLVQNIQWSQRGNMMGIPTDCCQRDERCGYTGDANFFMGTAVYNFDVAAFFSKWLIDVCEDSQMPGGWFTDHAPHFGPGPGPNIGWSDAGIFCPYRMYRTYGDTRLLQEHYPAMKRCLEWEIRTANPDGTRGPAVGNGDWLNLCGGASGYVIATAHYAYSLQLMAEIAQVIGQYDDAIAYRAMAKKAAAAFTNILVQPGGTIKDSSQTGYALAFTMNLVPTDLKAKMSQHFAEEIERFNDHLATGFIGTPRLLPGLHQAGRDDLAYHLLLNEDFPSWLFEIKNGATTTWERWDGWRPDKGFQASGMNSFNHYSFGAVGEYLFSVVGGIREETPGFQRFIIAPVAQPGLQWAKTSYTSIHGPIRASWNRSAHTFALDVTIPPNTSATVILPADDPDLVTESGQPASQADGVTLLRADRHVVVYRVGSGTYQFVSQHIRLARSQRDPLP